MVLIIVYNLNTTTSKESSANVVTEKDDDVAQREEEDTRLKYETALMDKGTSSIGNEGIDRAPTDKEESLNVQFTYMLEIGSTEVTQRLYRNVMDSNPVADEQDCHRWNPDVPPGPNMPVYCVSFKDAASFANKFSMAQGLDPCYIIDDMTDNVRWPKGTKCTGWRLPTEAEWEAGALYTRNGHYGNSRSMLEAIPR